MPRHGVCFQLRAVIGHGNSQCRNSGNTNCERRFLKTAKRGEGGLLHSLPRRGSQLISIVPYSRRPCAYRALPIVNSAHTERGKGGSTEREKERGALPPPPRPVPLVRSEHDDIRTGPEKTSLSTWKPARRNEGASKRANERFGIRYYL